MTALLPIVGLTIDAGLQNRAAMDADTIGEYAEAIRSGATFPPIVVFTNGEFRWVVDGFHRVAAYQTLGEDTITADIHQGSYRDAVLYSVGVNDKHGLKRTNADKRKAVMKLLCDAEWAQWSDNEIGRRCGVSHSTVATHRPSLANSSSEKTYITKHGTVATMKTENIGKATPPKVYSDTPTQAYVAPFSPCPACAVEFARLVSLLVANGIVH